MTSKSAHGFPFRLIEEVLRPGYPDRWVHPEWEIYFPWLVQGTTGRTVSAEKAKPAGRERKVPVPDFSLARDDQPTGESGPWASLARSLEFSTIVGSRQVHGETVLFHEGTGFVAGSVGSHEVTIAPDADGHSSTAQGILMGVTVADCIPVFLADPTRRALALLHAGWRGVAGGILEAGIKGLAERLGSRARDLFVHMGPAICGSCYEVGPEVYAALGLTVPDQPTAVDLRDVLGRRALTLGVMEGHITVSGCCTLCSGSAFFSHRGGDQERQMGYLGVRPRP